MESIKKVHSNSLINFSWSYVPRRLILELLDVSVMTLDEWDRKNILKKRKIGGKVYYKLEEVEAVLEQSIG
ncbi:helix-turn-helix domain-containing protein [Flagellimonas sp.]|uniref:helix-turn-helix domain-containing protein n=1 Tax=Flagellimonas sp. TaxID=2058762 RepID=UPI003BAB98BB